MATYGWDLGSVEVTVDGGTQTYQYPLPDGDAVDVGTALCAWVLSPSRVWNGKVSACTFSFSSAGQGCFEFVLQPTTGYAWSMAVADTWTQLLAHDGIGPLIGSVDADFILQSWVRWDPEAGLASRSASVRPSHRRFTARRPRVEAWLDPSQHLALAAAIRASAEPRTAKVWEETAGAWRQIAVGAITFDTDDPSWTKVGVEALG